MRLQFLYTLWCLILILYCLKFLNEPNITLRQLRGFLFPKDFGKQPEGKCPERPRIKRDGIHITVDRRGHLNWDCLQAIPIFGNKNPLSCLKVMFSSFRNFRQ